MRARGQGRIPWRLAPHLPTQFLNLRLQIGKVRQWHADSRLSFRRLASNQFFRDYRLHAHPCDTNPAFMSRSVSEAKSYHPVNGYDCIWQGLLGRVLKTRIITFLVISRNISRSFIL
jgi:hypothetical protein